MWVQHAKCHAQSSIAPEWHLPVATTSSVLEVIHIHELLPTFTHNDSPRSIVIVAKAHHTEVCKVSHIELTILGEKLFKKSTKMKSR